MIDDESTKFRNSLEGLLDEIVGPDSTSRLDGELIRLSKRHYRNQMYE